MTTLTLVIPRGDNSMAKSFLVWGAYRRVPQADGDGVFIGELPITAAEDVIYYDWDTPNGSDNWKFIAAPKFDELVGIFGPLTTV